MGNISDFRKSESVVNFHIKNIIRKLQDPRRFHRNGQRFDKMKQRLILYESPSPPTISDRLQNAIN